MSPEQTIRAYYDAYSKGTPQDFDTIIPPDYTDYGHTPPGKGPQGAKSDYDHAVKEAGGITTYDISGLVADDDGNVAVTWTGHLPSGSEMNGLSLYKVVDGQVLAVRHTKVAQ